MNTNKRKTLTRILSLLLVTVMLFGTVIGTALSLSAAEKKEKSYDIAVVFDNSYSMYWKENQAWARAKYAMEIFASMLDFNKDEPDKLAIFPMWEVTTDGTLKDTGYSELSDKNDPVTISSISDIDKLSKMYTVCASGTPFTTVEDAKEYILKSNADNKWLIILTDGTFDEHIAYVGSTKEHDEEKIKKNLESALETVRKELTAKDIKMQYVSFGGVNIASNSDKGLYATTCDDKSLMSELINICNRIFERHILPLDDYYKKGKLTLDLSMNKLIVFAQGEGAEINSLKTDSGSNITAISNSGQRKYSDVKYGTGRVNWEEKPDPIVTDTTLYGQVVTFDACPAGKYTLDVTGVDNDALQMFYEPDVDLVVEMFDKDGVKIDGEKDGIRAGDYKIVSKIVDGETGEDVTNHPLLGDSVEIKTYITDSSGNRKEYENGATVTFDEDGGTDILVEGTYLKDYKIKSTDYSDFDWMTDIKVAPEANKFVVSLNDVESRYVLMEHEKWKAIKIGITLEGQDLPDEEISKIELKVTIDNKKNDIDYRYEIDQGKSGFNLYLAQNSNGDYVEPKEGKYKIYVETDYADPYGEVFNNHDDKNIRVDKDPLWVDVLKVLIPVLIAIAVIVAVACIPVSPKEFYIVDSKTGDFDSVPCRGGVMIADPKSVNTTILSGTGKVIAKSNNFLIASILKPKRQSFMLTEISAMPRLNYIRYKGNTYTNVNGELRSNGKAVPQLVISNGDIEIKVNERALFKGKIKINKV